MGWDEWVEVQTCAELRERERERDGKRGGEGERGRKQGMRNKV